jgi:hypothetical protein
MKLIANNILLFIEPLVTEESIDDELTQKIKFALDNFVEENVIVGGINKKTKLCHIEKDTRVLGVHKCICGTRSESADYGILIDGTTYYTNSLADHYVQYHRSSVSKRDLELINKIIV